MSRPSKTPFSTAIKREAVEHSRRERLREKILNTNADAALLNHPTYHDLRSQKEKLTHQRQVVKEVIGNAVIHIETLQQQMTAFRHIIQQRTQQKHALTEQLQDIKCRIKTLKQNIHQQLEQSLK